MKVGDLVRFYPPERVAPYRRTAGIVIKIYGRDWQPKVDVLFFDGVKIGIWKRKLEVINESR